VIVCPAYGWAADGDAPVEAAGAVLASVAEVVADGDVVAPWQAATTRVTAIAADHARRGLVTPLAIRILLREPERTDTTDP
jgi:hypothetical protein